MTFTALYDAYLRTIDATRTHQCYGLAYSQFVTHLRDQGLNDDARQFCPDQIESFRDRFLAGGMKKNSVRTKLAALYSLGKWGMQTRIKAGGSYYLNENPVDRVKRPKKERVREKYLTRQELATLLSLDTAPNERLAIDLFLDTACRAGELADARVKDLRLDGETTILTVRLKGGRYKDIVLGTEIAAALTATLRQREVRPDDPVLVNQAGHRYNRSTLSEVVFRLGKRAGIDRIPVRAHVLRKTWANLAHESGATVADIAGGLNHSGIGTVQKYVFAKDDRVESAKALVREVLHAH